MTQTLREQVARLIEPEEFQYAKLARRMFDSNWIELSPLRVIRIQSAYDRADAILALVQPQWLPIDEGVALRAQLAKARAKADDWQAMKDECNAAKCDYANLLDDTNGEIAGLRRQLAEREGLIQDLAMSLTEAEPFIGYAMHVPLLKADVARALARFHAAEDKSHDA